MSTAAVEPNLVKMDTVAMEEVNNNNFQERVVGKKAVNPAFSSNLDPMTTPSTVVDDDLVSDNINQKEVEDDSSTNSINEAIENASSTAAASTQALCSSTTTSSSIYCLNDKFRLTVTCPEEWLCVARMPMDFSKAEFEDLVQGYGPVSQSFLIHSETSGTFKGYGLVKYVSKESSIQARHVLDGHEVRNGHVLNCDWLRHNAPGMTSLHSKCLYVDQLPESYRDMAEFRRLFSKIVNPPYCQIAIKNGVIHNWGLVEFQSSQEAESTFHALQGQTLQDHPIRVQFCIPGVHAINIYMAFVNDPMDAVQERKALLDETPSTKVYEQLNALSKQNPWFVANLQTIMASSAITNNTPVPFQCSPPLPVINGGNGTDLKGGSADPAQAALILFLAGKVANGPTEQTTNLLQGIVKQMTNGVKATEILRTILPASSSSQNTNEADLIQTAINMAGTSTKNTSPVPTTSCSSTAASAGAATAGSIIASGSAATTTSTANHCSTGNGMDSSTLISSGLGSQPSAAGSSGRSDKCPLLMELLYKSFQAKLAKEHRLKLALQHEQQQQQQSSLKHKPAAAASHFSQTAMTSAITSGCLNKANSINTANSLVTQQPTVNTNQGPVVSQCNGINVHVSPASMAAASQQQQQQTAVAAHEAALAAAMMHQQQQHHHQTAAAVTTPTAFLLSPEPNILTAAVQHHQQQQQHQHPPPPQQHHHQAAVPYPYIQAYYSQMINPNAAAAGLWPFPTAATSALPLIHQTSAAEAAVAASQLMMPANVMPYNQIGHGPGVKRAAAPVMYANVEKRMKLA